MRNVPVPSSWTSWRLNHHIGKISWSSSPSFPQSRVKFNKMDATPCYVDGHPVRNSNLETVNKYVWKTQNNNRKPQSLRTMFNHLLFLAPSLNLRWHRAWKSIVARWFISFQGKRRIFRSELFVSGRVTHPNKKLTTKKHIQSDHTKWFFWQTFGSKLWFFIMQQCYAP